MAIGPFASDAGSVRLRIFDFSNIVDFQSFNRVAVEFRIVRFEPLFVLAVENEQPDLLVPINVDDVDERVGCGVKLAVPAKLVDCRDGRAGPLALLLLIPAPLVYLVVAQLGV